MSQAFGHQVLIAQADLSQPFSAMVSPAMLKGMNTEVYGEGHPFGDPSWYQAYNTPYYNDSHKQFRKLMREYVDEHIMSNVHDWDEKLGLGIPYFHNFLGTCYLNGSIMKRKSILFSPWLLQSPGRASSPRRCTWRLASRAPLRCALEGRGQRNTTARTLGASSRTISMS